MIKTTKILALTLAATLALSLLLIWGADALSGTLRHRREQLYYHHVLRAATEFDVPVPLILAVIRTESDFRPQVVSSAGAVGLMQLLPQTFTDVSERLLQEENAVSEIYDPATNIRYGTCYLAYLYRQFGDWETALAAYNAGEGRVRAWLADEAIAPDGALKTIPYPETARYVQSVNDALAHYRDKYNF